MVAFRRTLSRPVTSQYEPTEASTSPSSLAGPTSATTLSSPSMSSIPSTSTLSTTHQCKYAATRPGDLSLALRFRSRASSANDVPTYHRGDNITGDVVLTLTPEQAQHVTWVEVELRGETSAKGSGSPYSFLSRRSILWTSSASSSNVATAHVIPKGNAVEMASLETAGRARDVQAPSPLADQLHRSPSAHSFSIRSALQSFQAIGRTLERQIDGIETLSTTPPQISKSRNRLEPSRAHVWPFELSIPVYVSRSAKPDLVQLHTSGPSHSHHLVYLPQQDNETGNEEENGGIRLEKVGGVGWDEGGRDMYSRHKVAMNQSNNEDSTKAAFSTGINLSKNEINSPRGNVGNRGMTSVDDRDLFTLPPSFSERTGFASLDYKLVVTVHRRGVLRDNWTFQRKLHVPYYSYAESNTNLPLRAVHPNVAASKLPGPLEHPDGWNFLPEVVMHLQPKISRSKGGEYGIAKREMAFKLALSRPLCYNRGATIPFRITVSIPQPRIATPHDNVEISKGRKLNKSSASTSHTAGFSVPSFALFPKSNATVAQTSGARLSNVGTRAPSRLALTPPSEEGEAETEANPAFVPSTAAVASAIRLVRAVHVGADANDDRNMRRDSQSFLHNISTAVIIDDDEPAPNDSEEAGRTSGESDDEFKGWTKERERLVRTFVGEIPLKEDIKPSFAFPYFVLRYAVVLFPFETCGYAPSSHEPLWSEPVNIVACPVNAGPATTSQDQPVIDKVHREIYARYFASSNNS